MYLYVYTVYLTNYKLTMTYKHVASFPDFDLFSRRRQLSGVLPIVSSAAPPFYLDHLELVSVMTSLVWLAQAPRRGSGLKPFLFTCSLVSTGC